MLNTAVLCFMGVYALSMTSLLLCVLNHSLKPPNKGTSYEAHQLSRARYRARNHRFHHVRHDRTPITRRHNGKGLRACNQALRKTLWGMALIFAIAVPIGMVIVSIAEAM